MTKDGEAARVRELAEQLTGAETIARALRYMVDNGLPTTPEQASLLRTSNAVESLARVLEPPNDIVQRNQAMHVVERMCRLDRQCHEPFISLGIVRKLIKNAESSLSSGMDVPAAVRTLSQVVGGPVTPASAAAVEDLFLSGTVLRLRDELGARKKADDMVAAIGQLLAAVVTHPATHSRLCDAHLPPMLPRWIEAAPAAAAPAGGGASSAAASASAFVELAYQLSLTEAVAAAHMRNESYFEALHRVVMHTGAPPALRRTGLLAICNIFGGDSDHVRAEEVLRTHSAPAMLAAMLAAVLAPSDVGAAARAASTSAASAASRRSVGSSSGVLGSRALRQPDTAASGPLPSPPGGMGGTDRSRASPHKLGDPSGAWSGGGAGVGGVGGGFGGGGAAGGGLGLVDLGIGLNGLGNGLRNGFGLRSRRGGDHGEHGDRKLTNGGYTDGASAVARVSYGADVARGGGGGLDMTPPPTEAILHSLKCVAANPMIARKLARTGSPSFVLPALLDIIVSSQQHVAAGELPRAAWSSRAVSAAQVLLRMSSCVELVPSLRNAGALAPLRLLAMEADDPRASEAARGALLYMGDAGQAGHASRAVAAAFRALYRNGGAPAGSEPELGNRFQVFVSHHRADAHLFSLYTLYPLLVMQGLPTFVDPQHRSLSSDWAHMIACCRNLVVVLSEMLLGSPDHLREAETAVQAGVTVVVVVPEGSKWADSQGNKTLDSPPPAVLESLPPRLKAILSDKPLVYSSSRHSDFTQQLLSRLRLPASTVGDGGPMDGVGVGSPPPRMSMNGIDGRGRSRGGGEDGPRVSFTSEGELQLLQQQTAEEEAQEEAEEAAAAEAEAAADPVQQLPWPWRRLFDSTATGADDEEGGPVRYPRVSFPANGNSHAGDTLSGSGGRESSATVPAVHTAAPPAGGAPASYTSRRFAFRQRSSINRHAALQLQQQQQQYIVQQQWVQEFHNQVLTNPQPTQPARPQPPAHHPSHQPHKRTSVSGSRTSAPGSRISGQGSIEEDEELDLVRPMACELVVDGPGVTMLNQLLALQVEMVRYELRQALQASHETVTHKMDRLRSDVTEQVVQLRFDLAGKIETLQETLAKAIARAASGIPSTATDAGAATAHSSGNGGVIGADGRYSSPSKAAMQQQQQQQHVLQQQQLQQQQQQQQLAAALSASMAASLQDVVNKAVAQLQATVAPVLAVGGRPNGAVLGAPGPLGVPAPAGGKGGQQGAAAILAAAAQQQQQQQAAAAALHNPHPSGQQPNSLVRGSVVLVPQSPHVPHGVELSPVARAGAAAWSGDGTGNNGGGGGSGGGAHGGGAKSHSSHATVATGVAAGGSGGAAPRGGNNPPGGAANATAVAAVMATRPGALAMYDAAAAAEAGTNGIGGGGAEPTRVMSPNALIASVTSPATAQAALLLAGRARQYGGHGQPAAAAIAGGDRGGSGGSAGAANGIGGRTGGLHVLPPLAGLGGGGGGPLSPTSSSKPGDRKGHH